MNKQKHYDLIIVGGGLVGTSLLLAVADLPLKIALIDARPPTQDDARLFALNSSSCHLLAHLQLWSMLQVNASPIEKIQVTHQGRFGSVNLEEVGSPLGYVVPAKYIEAAFNQALDQVKTDTLTIYRPARLQALQQTQDHVSLILDTPAGEVHLSAAYVIGADGAQSTVRAAVAIETEVDDHEQTAIVTQTFLSGTHAQIAYERFTSDGAIAMLPLKEKCCATIWTVEKNKAKQLMAGDEQHFLQSLQREFGYRLGRFKHIAHRHHYPLIAMRAKKTVKDRVMLIGNAAHVLHPITASGFNLALYEVAVLAEAIKQATQVRQGAPYFSSGNAAFASEQHSDVLDCFQNNISHPTSQPIGRDIEINLLKISEQMREQQAKMIKASYHLAHMFKQPSRSANILLTLGMISFDRATPIKKKFIDTMMGRLGSLPRLLMSESR